MPRPGANPRGPSPRIPRQTMRRTSTETAPAPTLLVFTLGAAAERLRRPLLPAAHGAAELELRRSLLERTLAAGRRVGCRLRVSSPRPLPLPSGVRRVTQQGRGFGERLERACAAAAPAGGPLLVVGTDVPGLTDEHLRRALQALRDEPRAVVLGPSPDGGFYLLATARPIPGLARLTRWCRRDTLALLRRALRAAGRPVVLLAPLADLDRRSDLESWLARRPRRFAAALLRRLAALLAALRRAAAPVLLPRPAPVPVRPLAPRAPPPRRRV